MRMVPLFLRLFALLPGVLMLSPAAMADSRLRTRDPVQLSLIAAGPDQVGLQVRLAPGWKFYWRSPGEGGVPPRFDWSQSQNLAKAEIAWPAPRRISIGSADLHGYTGEVLLPVALTPQRSGEAITLALDVEFGICKEICILREEKLARLLPAGMTVDAGAAELLARWQDRVPRPAPEAGIALAGHRMESGRLVVALHSETPFERPDLFVEAAPEVWFGRPELALSADRRAAHFTVPVQPERALKDSGPLVLTVTDAGRAAELRLQP